MPDSFEILQPQIFNAKHIISGVTLRNERLFPDKGFSIFPGKILTDEETENNRLFLAKYLGFQRENLKFQRQVHSSEIRVIDTESPEVESDGMITDKRGLLLNVTIADCCSILIHEPEKNAIAALHSGWRGTKENIAKKGIDIMAENYGCNPATMRVFLSPCASVRTYEVGAEVAEHFSGFAYPKPNGKYLLDIPSCINSQLTAAGIIPENIEKTNICTIEDTRFHSYRRDGSKSGRMAAFIALLP
jgi:YfiH family protein